MEFFLLCLFLLVVYLVVRMCVSVLTFLGGGRKYIAYQTLAHHFRGRLESRGISDTPTVSFQHKGAQVRVGLAPLVPGQNLPPRTRVVVRFAKGLPLRMELLPKGRPLPPQLPRGTKPIPLGGERGMDFVLRANDGDMAQALLSPPIEKMLRDLVRLAPPYGMLLSVNPERLLVQIDRNLGRDAPALINMVRSALVLHDNVVELVPRFVGSGIAIEDASIQFLDVDDGLGAPICKVCCEPVTTDFVRCSQCQAPHHRDCWDFTGGCAIYGCQSRQSH